MRPADEDGDVEELVFVDCELGEDGALGMTSKLVKCRGNENGKTHLGQKGKRRCGRCEVEAGDKLVDAGVEEGVGRAVYGVNVLLGVALEVDELRARAKKNRK